MPMAEVTVIPLGVGPSVGRFVAECLRLVRRSGLRYRLTPTSTVIEGSLDEIFAVVREIHEVPFSLGAPRVVTVVKIDDRRDKPEDMDYKIRSVEERLGDADADAA